MFINVCIIIIKSKLIISNHRLDLSRRFDRSLDLIRFTDKIFNSFLSSNVEKLNWVRRVMKGCLRVSRVRSKRRASVFDRCSRLEESDFIRLLACCKVLTGYELISNDRFLELNNFTWIFPSFFFPSSL